MRAFSASGYTQHVHYERNEDEVKKHNDGGQLNGELLLTRLLFDDPFCGKSGKIDQHLLHVVVLDLSELHQ